MLDTTRFVIPIEQGVNAVTEYAKRYPSRASHKWGSSVKVPGPLSINAFVKPTFDGTGLVIEACAPRFLLGHNVFGSDDIQGQISAIAQYIEGEMGLGKELSNALGKAEFHRLDLVVNLKLDDGTGPEDALEALDYRLNAMGSSLATYARFGRVESLYRNPRSKGRDLFYNKARHVAVAHTAISPLLKGRQRIKRWARCVLRYETRLGWSELRKDPRQLHRLGVWTPKLVREVISERLARIKVDGGRVIPIPRAQLSRLSPRLRAWAMLHAYCAPLQKALDRRTYRRARERILKDAGIDLFDKPSKRSGMSLERLVNDPARRIYGRPRWARKRLKKPS